MKKTIEQIIEDIQTGKAVDIKVSKLIKITYKHRLTLKGHKKEVTSLTVTTEGHIVSGSKDKSIKVWDLKRGTCERSLYSHTGAVQALAITSHNHIISGSQDYTIKVWNPATGTCERTLYTCYRMGGGVWAMALLPDGRLVAGSRGVSKLEVWDLTNDTCERIPTIGGIWALTVTANGQLVSGTDSGSTDMTITVRDPTLHTCEQTFDHPYGVLALATTPKGRVISGGSFGRSIVWNLETKTREYKLDHGCGEHVLTVTPNGYVVSGSADGTIKVWNMANGICEQTLGDTVLSKLSKGGDANPHVALLGAVRALAATPKHHIVSGKDDGTLDVWSGHSASNCKLSYPYIKPILDTLIACGQQPGGITLHKLDLRGVRLPREGYNKLVNLFQTNFRVMQLKFDKKGLTSTQIQTLKQLLRSSSKQPLAPIPECYQDPIAMKVVIEKIQPIDSVKSNVEKNHIAAEHYLNPQAIVQYCDQKNIMGFKAIDGDGNCFFRAVLAALGRDENEHMALRQQGINYIRNHLEKFPGGCFAITKAESDYPMPFEDYLIHMAQKGIYAEGPILEATGLALSCQIDVIQLTRGNGEPETDGRFTVAAIENAPQTILLLRVNNNHYHATGCLPAQQEQTRHAGIMGFSVNQTLLSPPQQPPALQAITAQEELNTALETFQLGEQQQFGKK